MVARRRIKAKRAERLVWDPPATTPHVPVGALMADQAKLLHDNTYGARPLFYVDTHFTCRECGVEEVWSAAQQKWWYEEAKGKIDSRAVKCRACRRARQEARRQHVEGLVARYGLENAAERLFKSVAELEALRRRWTMPLR
jgi:hypothetical protein